MNSKVSSTPSCQRVLLFNYNCCVIHVIRGLSVTPFQLSHSLKNFRLQRSFFSDKWQSLSFLFAKSHHFVDWLYVLAAFWMKLSTLNSKVPPLKPTSVEWDMKSTKYKMRNDKRWLFSLFKSFVNAIVGNHGNWCEQKRNIKTFCH